MTPTPEALARARGLTAACVHTHTGYPDEACDHCIALALTEQARAHEKCIEEIQADQLAMANRENELHDETDARLAEQTSEIERLKILWDVIEDMPETGGYPTLAQWESVIDAHEAARAAAQGGKDA